MEVVWVYDNIKQNKHFYSRFNILMLIASVSLWRKYHPKHKTVIYVDDMTNDLFSELGIKEIWHSVRKLEYPERINKSIFWSGCKTKIISETDIPILLVDHDFLIFTNIDEHLNGSIICSYDELTTNWYPHQNDIWNKKLTTPIEHITNRASNVSLFYLPNPEFANRYGKQTLINHEEFSSMKEKDMTANHMIYSEQFMLRQWIEKESIDYKTLSKNIWDCKEVKPTSTLWEHGIWGDRESVRNYKHYGMEKRYILDDRLNYGYDQTMHYLYRCTNAGRLLDIATLKTNLKTIENR